MSIKTVSRNYLVFPLPYFMGPVSVQFPVGSSDGVRLFETLCLSGLLKKEEEEEIENKDQTGSQL